MRCITLTLCMTTLRMLMLAPSAAGLMTPLSPPPDAGRAIAAFVEVSESAVEKSREVKCPFFRRRFGDVAEAVLAVAEFIAARHKSILDRPWLPGFDGPGDEALPWVSSSSSSDLQSKTTNLPVEAVMELVRDDFTDGQYYVSGYLNPSIYSDSCFFDGPDPDMPVRSLER